MVAQPIMIAASTNIVQPQLMSSEANAGLNWQMALFVLEIKNVFISFVPGVFVPLVTRMHIVHLVNFVATNMCLLLKMFVPDIVTKFVFSVRHAVVLVKLVGGDLRVNNIIAIKKNKSSVIICSICILDILFHQITFFVFGLQTYNFSL